MITPDRIEARLDRDEARLAFDEARLDEESEEIRENGLIAKTGIAFAVVLALGLQTDVIGIPWLAVIVWALAGDAATRRPA